jgi:hypothetical protein
LTPQITDETLTAEARKYGSVGHETFNEGLSNFIFSKTGFSKASSDQALINQRLLSSDDGQQRTTRKLTTMSHHQKETSRLTQDAS